MSLAPLVGHTDLRERLSRAITSGSLPQVLLLTGATGVGKQRLGLWIAQRLICQTPDGIEPCGRCNSCLRVAGLSHPDLHWMMPIPRHKATDPEKMVEEAAESIENILAERRANPLWGRPEPMSLHGMATARLILRRAGMTSVEGGPKVFLISHADLLVPQESADAGANALLKLLEEPSPTTWFILTTTSPGQVLPTIRSRAIPLRLGALRTEQVLGFLKSHRPEMATQAIAERSRGSIGMALAGGGADPKATVAAEGWLSAVGEGTSAATERALRQGPWQARGDFTHLLDAVAVQLAEQARHAVQSGAGARAVAASAGIDRVLVTRERAQGNVNPQLLMAVLGDELTQLGAA